MNWILQVQRQRLLIEKSSSMLMKQTGMMVSNLNIAQVRRKRRPHTGGFGAFWDGVTIRTVISIFNIFRYCLKRLVCFLRFAYNINNSGCISALNEKVTKWAFLGSYIKKVTSECFATQSANVTAGARKLVPVIIL